MRHQCGDQAETDLTTETKFQAVCAHHPVLSQFANLSLIVGFTAIAKSVRTVAVLFLKQAESVFWNHFSKTELLLCSALAPRNRGSVPAADLSQAQPPYTRSFNRTNQPKIDFVWFWPE
jgi:hypothetical protein